MVSRAHSFHARRQRRQEASSLIPALCPHLQQAQRLLALHDGLVAGRGRQVAGDEEGQHGQRRNVDAQVLERLLQLGRAFAACIGSEGV